MRLDHILTPRATTTMATVAAAMAVFLALVGVYGVLMTSVEQRQRELAIRSASVRHRRQ